MLYDLNQIDDPLRFQRLVNSILTARFGEDIRLTPLRGPDGGSDGETAPNNPNMKFRNTRGHSSSNRSIATSPRPGRYLFQAKYHRTGEQRLSDLRRLVVREFERELQCSVLGRPDRRDVDYFFLVTNVPASKDALDKVDDVCRRLLKTGRGLHADIWWQEQITALLDALPHIWLAFPEIFPGHVPPMLAQALSQSTERVPNAFRLAALQQYKREIVVKFRQIELEQKLFDLFVDLDIEFNPETYDALAASVHGSTHHPLRRNAMMGPFGNLTFSSAPTALELLIDDELSVRRILLEGGPGQGKSTITQMAAQIYREKLLGDDTATSRGAIWREVCNMRYPFRIELRRFADWLSDHDHGTVEQYIALIVGRDSGGASVTVEDIQGFVMQSSVILFLDGLDEIGSDTLRDRVVEAVMDTIRRFEGGLRVDLRVVLTTRPPAVAGRRDRLEGFARVVLAPMKKERIDDYLGRWLEAQIQAPDERRRIRASFDGRRHEPHVDALARNPMQLSVLLQFIYLKGEAFPDRRAELYREYFEIVIDRDVEKSPELRDNRDSVEGLHEFFGFHFHGMTEIDQGRRTLTRGDIIDLADRWLRSEGHDANDVADRFFALGEERFGLIVAVSGEGQETSYGFEVQPIQEYFAASYISNRLTDGKAHEIFELLIHRSYWREVALFLAGLRRPNEKADLISRARGADRDVSRGWQQNGRAIVLQLLREGVLHQPRHVLTEALDFVADLLDMRKFCVQRTPEALIETLCMLGERYPNETLRHRIAEVVESYSQSDDEYALAVIHRVAARLLPSDHYTKIVLDYKGTRASTRSLVRMNVPYDPKSSANLAELASSADYWRDVPLPIWAPRFWRSALHYSLVLDIECPPGMHFNLVVEFATDYQIGRDTDRRPIEIRGSRPMAIWKLLQNVQLMSNQLPIDMEFPTLGRSQRRGSGVQSQRPILGDLSYRFLPEEVVSCLQDLIVTSNGILSSMASEPEAAITDKISSYITAIRKHLKDPGISGWIACRCAIQILQRRRSPGPMNDLLESLSDFYSMTDVPPRLQHIRQLLHSGMPLGVRLSKGTPPIPLHRIIAESLKSFRGRVGDTNGGACSWIADIPLPSVTIRPLVELCRRDLTKLLRFVGDRLVVGFHHELRLRIQDTRRILKICRETNDEEVLRGAATILPNAAFSRIAEPELIVKILSAAPSSMLLFQVFSSMGEFVEERGSDRRKNELALSQTVAKLILEQPQRYAFLLTSRAAVFIAETEASESTPLFEERPDLLRPPDESAG